MSGWNEWTRRQKEEAKKIAMSDRSSGERAIHYNEVIYESKAMPRWLCDIAGVSILQCMAEHV